MKNESNRASGIPIIEDPEFSYDGFQVVRGEFFAHLQEPSFTFNNYSCAVNAACIKKLPEFNYIQVLVNPETKKLAVRPCQEEEKDSFRWSTNAAKKGPRSITCRIFFAKVFSLMGWDPNYRYKLLGKLIRSNEELLFIFDLTSPQIFVKEVKENGKQKTARTATYPEEWKTQFGLPVEEHRKSIQILNFNGCTVFGMQQESRKGKSESEAPANVNPVLLSQNKIANRTSYDTDNGNRLQEEPYTYSQENLALTR